MRILFAILTALSITGAAQANDIVRVKASDTVANTMAELEKAVKEAGAFVFARVDHGAGAAQAGIEQTDSQLLIFGNPKIGAPAMQEDPLAGLFLPLRVLVYEDPEGQVWLAYEDPTAMLGPLEGTTEGAEYLAKMTGALKKLTGIAAAPEQ